MKHFRKCNTTKYRRRREKEKIAHVERVERRRQEDIAYSKQRQRELDQYLALKRDFYKQEQALVNVLAWRLYQLSPEYAEHARARAARETLHSIWNLFN